MSSDRSAEELRLLERALDLPESEQLAFLDRECGSAELRRRIVELLRRDRRLGAQHDDNPFAPERIYSEVLPAAVLPGRRIGAYQIAEEIGCGGMGTVYRAFRIDGQVEQEVAIKLTRGDRVNSALLQRFSNERRLLASLDHPGICRFIDAGMLPGDRPYVLMELVRGEPLLDYCDRLALGIRARLRLFRKVLAAVAHAHRNLVLHRDIKSGNILVGDDGEPKLLDFGIAKVLDNASPEFTATDERFLTPRYAAPEQLAGEAVGIGCDIYGLGALLFQLLTGLPVFDFDGRTPGEIERLVREIPPTAPSRRCLAHISDAPAAAAGDPSVATRGLDAGAMDGYQERRLDAPAMRISARGLASPAALVRALRGDLDAIVLTCLRKLPAQRYLSVEQLDNEIAQVLDRRPIQARGGERWYRMRRFAVRHRIPLSFAAALLLSLLVSLLVITHQRDTAVRERDRARHAVDLLRSAFLSADPARVAGGEVTARQILNSAKPALEPSFDSQPELYASMATVVAEVELGLHMAAEAAALAERALFAAQRAGQSQREMRRLRIVHARALIQLGRTSTAAELLDRLEAEETDPGPDLLLSRALLMNQNGEHMAAIPLLERTVAATRAAPATNDDAVAARLHLAYALGAARRHADSLAKLDETLDWLRSELHAQHPALLSPQLMRIDALRQLGQRELALEEALDLEHRIADSYGADSPLAGRVHTSIAVILRGLDRLDEAIERQRTAVTIWHRSLGRSHPNTIRATFNLATMLAGHPTQSDDAETAYREAIRAAEEHAGRATGTGIRFRIALAEHLGRRTRWPDAIEVLTTQQRSPEADPATESAWIAAVTDASEQAGCRTVEHRSTPPCALVASWLAGLQPVAESGANFRVE